MPIDSTNVAPPEHPLPRLATFELTRYRRELERAPETTAYRLRRAAGPPGAAERGAGRAGIAREDRERVCQPEERPWTVKPSGDLAERVFRGTAENQLPDVRRPKIMADMDH